MANTVQGIVKVGDLEMFLPGDLTDFEMERAAGESDKDFQEAREMYSLLFWAARLLLNRSEQ
jgi:hypothetical protein